MVKLLLKGAIGMILLSTVAATMIPTGVEAGPQSPASVLSFERHHEALVFNVVSHGCTSKNDFNLQFSDSPAFDKVVYWSELRVNFKLLEEIVYVKLVRLKEDSCRRRAKAQALSFPVIDLLEQKPIQVMNTFIALKKITRE